MNIAFGTTGYVISTVGFLFLFLLLLTTRQQSFQRSLLIFASLSNSVWALNSSVYFYHHFSVLSLLPVETIRNLSWFLLLLSSLSRKPNIKTLISTDKVTRQIILFLTSCFFLESSYSWIAWLPYRYIILLHLVQSSVGLWLIEQLYRRTTKQDRWMIKPICLGLGVTFAYDFALYANGVLTNRIDTMFFYGRGWVTIITLPLIIMTARRVKEWSTRIYISRDIVYSSTLLTVAGIYLLIMAFTGYYIRYIGGDWGNMVQNIFFALSGLILASLFMSESLRRQLKVFITKHFYANKYEYREEWTKFASTLEEDADSPYQVSLNAMIRPFDCERGMLAIMENGKLKKKAFYNQTEKYPESDNILEQLSANAIEHHWIIDIQDLKNETTKVPFKFDSNEIASITTFSYIIPITDKNTVKAVCFLSPPNSTHHLNWEDRDLMWAISKQLAVYLSLYHTNKKLTENEQFDTFNRMSAFLAHDLKNILAQLQLLSKNAKHHKDNPEFIDDAFDTIDSAVIRLNKVVDHLKKKNPQSNSAEVFDVEKIIQQACHEREIGQPNPTYETTSEKPFSLNTDRERFRNMLSHLIQNAQDATTPEGTVAVKTSTSKNDYVICIEDNGIGMSEDFIENRLFKPFDTTKGNSGMGIGAYDAKKMIEQLNGHISVESKKGQGTRFSIHIPLSECSDNNTYLHSSK
ncbi:XrtA/PEP-CTERM system histidine kinase PrsK [Vibrio salinus]|uniref:XrtA/PEP-CTERM system histidine kinase PrsK n=1 Tax=Vibrio salinus TaxID=2899784 RepID=UPI001E5EABCC|nr:XrtA/PEP-CTERM system histidine kinase PrsK [Vibrio salinus]MCE0493284.1 PEP-CTERM system histidine kinase PrsK [Vibrio salinus]